jgi:carboxymethylenebutenolidase
MSEDRQDLFRYVVEEFAEDYHEGEIDRREFVRRMGLLGGGTVGAKALLTSLGIVGVTSAEMAQAMTAKPPVEPAVKKPMVDPKDPTLMTEMLTWDARGFKQMAYLARPVDMKDAPGVLVIHENRGLQPHLQDIARRLAKAGFVALAVDLMSKQGGTAKFTDTAQISSALAQTPGEEHVANLLEAVKKLKEQKGVGKIGAIGFCFGGGLTWRLSTELPELVAAVPFYGPAPDLTKVPNIKATVLGIYGGNDTRINAGIPALEEALKKAGTRYELKIYEGANHAFNNDTGANYKKEAADDAWARVLAFFGTQLKA